MSDVDLVSVLGRFVERGIALTSRGQLISAGHRAAAIYRKVYGKPPEKTPEIILKGGSAYEEFAEPGMVMGYRRSDIAMLDSAIDSVMSGAKAPVKGTRDSRSKAANAVQPRAKTPRYAVRPKETPVKQERLGDPYITADWTCWKCRRKILIYSWRNVEMWGTAPPPEPTPPTVKFAYSETISREYWANTCPYPSCSEIQGDFFLYAAPGAPFRHLAPPEITDIVDSEFDT